MKVAQRIPPLRGCRPVAAAPAPPRLSVLEAVLSTGGGAAEKEWGEWWEVLNCRFRAGEDVVLAPYIAFRGREGVGVILLGPGLEPLEPDDRFVVYRDGELEAGVDVYRAGRLPCPDMSCLHAVSVYAVSHGDSASAFPIFIWSSSESWSLERRGELVNGVAERVAEVLEGQPRRAGVDRRMERHVRRVGDLVLVDRLRGPREAHAIPILPVAAGEEVYLLPRFCTGDGKTLLGVYLLTPRGYRWEMAARNTLQPAPFRYPFFTRDPGEIHVAEAPRGSYVLFIGDRRRGRVREVERHVTEEDLQRYRDPFYDIHNFFY